MDFSGLEYFVMFKSDTANLVLRCNYHGAYSVVITDSRHPRIDLNGRVNPRRRFVNMFDRKIQNTTVEFCRQKTTVLADPALVHIICKG